MWLFDVDVSLLAGRGVNDYRGVFAITDKLQGGFCHEFVGTITTQTT